jgi:hypothetical protein
MATKTAKWGVGTTGWEVEWMTELPSGPDATPFTYARIFGTRKGAEAFAKKVFPRDQIGSVAITPFVMVWDSYRLRREYTSEPTYYEGD